MTDDIRKLSPTERARRVVVDGKRLWDLDASRRSRYLANLSRYEGRVCNSLIPASGYGSFAEEYDAATSLRVIADDAESAIRDNVSRSLVRTVTAKIAAVQQPKVVFVTSGADWSTRRKSRLMDQFTEGSFAARHEPYADVWDLGVTVFRDSAIFGIGAIKTWADSDAGAICRDRILPWELLCDPEEAQYGTPATLYHTYRANRKQLASWMPEHAEALERAPIDSLTDSAAYSPGQNSDMVRVWEMWRKSDGPKSPGCHTIVVQGIDSPLLDEELTGDPPISILRWDRDVRGFWGTSLLDEARPAEDEYNLTLARIARSVRATSMGMVFYPEGSVSKDAMLDSGDCLSIEYTGQQPPTYQSPSPFGPAQMQYLQMWRGNIFDSTGVNQMSATGTKQTGADSGVAIKTLVDMQSEIFATAWRNYQILFVDLARNGLEAGRRLAEDDPEWAVSWSGEGFLRQIPWSKVDLEADQYVCQIQSAPSSKGTAFERLKSAEELYGAGIITKDTLLAVKQYYDTPDAMDKASIRRSSVEKMIDRWLDATDEQIESNEYAPGVPLIKTPTKWTNIEASILQVAEAYEQAEMDDAPEAVLGLFLAWLAGADEVIAQKQRKQAELSAPPAGPSGAPAMPPGAPMGASPAPPQPLPGGMQ